MRFFAYAQRVRVINCDAHISTRTKFLSAAPEAYDILAGILGSRTLLPNVEKINYKRSEITPLEVFRSFHILYGPKLQALRICSYNSRPYGIKPKAEPPTDKEDEAFAQMLQKLADMKPRLQGIYIYTDSSSSTMLSSVVGAICALNHLVSLMLYNSKLLLSPVAFTHLAGLRGLRELDCKVGDSEDWADLPISLAHSGDDTQHTPFPVLRELRLTAPTLALSTSLLRFVGSPCLTELTITAEQAVPRLEIDPLFAAVASLRGARTITQFYVNVCAVVPTTTTPDVTSLSSPNRPPARPRPIGRVALEPLLAMPAIDDIMLEIHCPFDVDDALLEAFAKAWPKLDRLGLGAYTGSWGLMTEGDFAEDGHDPHAIASQHDGHAADPVTSILRGRQNTDNTNVWRKPRATLFGLLAFARHCPYAAVLQFELTASLRSIPPALLEARPTQTPGPRTPLMINGLYVGLSPIQDPYAVAAFLSDWVSGIDEIQDGWEDMMHIDSDEDEDDEADDGDEDEDDEVLGWPYVARIYHGRWQMVQRLIPMFAAVRMQERRWKRPAVGLPAHVEREERWEDDSMDPHHAPPGFWDGVHWW
ncbi:hypothetical protein TRAPUB_1869 [Trametes pubescens]|uniref:Uncharacterized protein n=1 Tax=Trametes pubescens TaxID=154538 RepID=A0A1M2VI69_TRAPU|nr:hypothetical protein TRAPUB_1869 [Trametes pubescens]